ncbi:MAG: hypothetical protein D4R65_10970 [Verrucomicrobiaceae bacterium]|nr:MAG: hypothetical protein D4R65_10970 [Verrucomicrobiaceae bacterium]
MNRITSLITLLLLSPLAVTHATAAADSAVNTRTEEFVYPPEVKGIIDVTKAPYFADPTGKKDCTAVLIQAIDDMMREDHRLMREALPLVQGVPKQAEYHDEKRGVYTATTLSFEERQRILKANPKALIGIERCKGVFPAQQPPAKILYFPNGTYLVSDTLTYSYTDLKIKFTEINRSMHFQGQSQQGTIIRLKDHAAGFEEGKAVVSFTHGEWSNVAMQNSFENFTIEVGAGNPGASGVEFYANNTGVVRNVTVRSLDPDKAGHAGLSLTVYNFSGVLVKNLDVEGFDYGVKVTQPRLYSVFENIHVSGQLIAGFYLEDNNVSLRRLTSRNKVPAVLMKGQPATMALVDGDFSGGGPETPAVECENGFLFARDLKTSGYGTAIQHDGQVAVKGPDVDEYVSSTVFTLFPGQKKQSLRLPIEETPELPWDKDPLQWAGVDAFGAKGDGFTDDTAAIQRAMNSGRPTVFFQPGTYLVNGPIDVPGSVRRINMMYCDLVAGGDLQKMTNAGLLRIRDGKKPLFIEKLFAFELYFGEHYLIDHASTRTLVLKDLHTQVGAMYRNSVPGGKVFIENVCSTDQFEPVRNCFTFTGQKVWARQINPERANPEVLNEGSSLWVLGFKSEGPGCAFQTTHGGSTEVLNGIFNLWAHREKSVPAIINDNSSASVVASTTAKEIPPYPYVLIEETRGDKTEKLLWESLPHRDEQLVAVPLYVGQNK